MAVRNDILIAKPFHIVMSHKKNKFKKLILTTIFFITFKTNPIYAKCYWLGYGANYKCNDNTGNQYYVFAVQGTIDHHWVIAVCCVLSVWNVQKKSTFHVIFRCELLMIVLWWNLDHLVDSQTLLFDVCYDVTIIHGSQY